MRNHPSEKKEHDQFKDEPSFNWSALMGHQFIGLGFQVWATVGFLGGPCPSIIEYWGLIFLLQDPNPHTCCDTYINIVTDWCLSKKKKNGWGLIFM